MTEEDQASKRELQIIPVYELFEEAKKYVKRNIQRSCRWKESSGYMHYKHDPYIISIWEYKFNGTYLGFVLVDYAFKFVKLYDAADNLLKEWRLKQNPKNFKYSTYSTVLEEEKENCQK